MKLNKLLKSLFAGVLAIANNVSSATLKKSEIVLPQGCENMKLDYGNPFEADTLYFGNIHNKEACQNSVATCAEAFAKNIPKDGAVSLFENTPHDATLDCNDDKGTWADKKLKNLFSECRGWDVGREKLNEIATQRHKENYKKIEDLLMSMRHMLPVNPSMEIAVEFIKTCIAPFENDNKKYRLIAQQKFQKLKLTRPKLSFKYFECPEKTVGYLGDILIDILKEIKNQIRKGFAYDAAIEFVIHKRSDETNSLEKKLFITPEGEKTIIGDRNRYLFMSTQRHNKRAKKVFAYAGRKHLNLDTDEKYNDMQNTYGKKYVEELYENLDKHSVKSAVLNCKN